MITSRPLSERPDRWSTITMHHLSRSIIPAPLFVGALIIYSLASLWLLLITAHSWDGLIVLPFGLPYFLLVLVGFELARYLARRSGPVVYHRWLLYPLLAVQAAALVHRVLFNAGVDMPLRSALLTAYVLLLPAFVLTVALSKPPAAAPAPRRPWLPLTADTLVVLALFVAVAVAREIAPAIRDARQAAACAEALAASANLPPDECRAPELFVIRPDGTGLARLTTGGIDGAPAWSPDGRSLAFTSGPMLSRIDADGAGTQLIATMAGPLSDLAWSPDGGTILFLHQHSGANEGSRPWEIYAVPSDGSGVPRLLDYGSYPSWSPDGRVLFVRETQGRGAICFHSLAEAATSCLRDLASGVMSPVWSPDGTRIAFAAGVTGSEIYTVSTDGSDLTRRTSAGGRNPRWLPGGALLFERDDAEARRTELCILDPGSGEVRCVATYPEGEGQAAWSPDGAELSFIARKEQATLLYELFLVRGDGTGQTRLAWNGFLKAPTWSPDGSLIAFQG